KSRMGGDVSDAIPDTADWPRFEKTNVADLRRNPNSHPDLDCLIRVDFDSAEGIDWLFSDNPVRREPIGPFCVDNLSGASLAPLIDDDGRRIQMAVKLECGDVKEGIWMCLEGRRIVVDVTQEDFDYVCTGNLLTKVVYLTRGVNDEEFGVLETIASSRLQPGVDPLAEADRRGFPIVSATFSPRPANLNESDRSALREAHGVDAIQNHSAIESVPSLRQLIGGRQLEPLGRYRKKLESAAPIRIAGKRGEVVLRPGQSRLVELPNPVLEFYWNQEGSKPTEGLADFEAFNFVLFEWETNGAFTATAYRSPIHQSLTTGDVEWRQAQSLMNLSLLKQQLSNLDRIRELKLSELGRKEIELASDSPVFLTGTETVIRRGESILVKLDFPRYAARWTQEKSKRSFMLQDTIEFDYILCEWRLDGTFIAKAYKSPAMGNSPFANQGLTASTINENGVRDTLKAFARVQAEYTPCVLQYRVWVTKPTPEEVDALASIGFAHGAQEFTCRYTFDGEQVSDKIIGYTVKGKPAEISAWLGRNSVEAPDSPFASIFPLGHSPQSPLHPEELQKNAGQMKYEQDMSNPRIKWTPRLYWTTKRDGAHVQMQLGFDGQQKRWVPSLVRSRMIHPDTPDEGMAVESRVEKWDIDSQGIPRMVSGTSR
ncbi:MAG: hypothetical protein KDA66_16645, partial [Planctomycetaceae bacterium]|nr:hypothetical protein [Planctomycetaceae bacterium]